MTGESGITTHSILSNVSDEDLGVVSGDDRTRSQGEGNCMGENNQNSASQLGIGRDLLCCPETSAPVLTRVSTNSRVLVMATHLL